MSDIGERRWQAGREKNTPCVWEMKVVRTYGGHPGTEKI